MFGSVAKSITQIQIPVDEHHEYHRKALPLQVDRRAAASTARSVLTQPLSQESAHSALAEAEAEAQRQSEERAEWKCQNAGARVD